MDPLLPPTPAHTNFRNLETLVIDNGSDDGSAEIISNEHPEVKLLAQRENIGLAAANNYAAKIARGEWLIPLNDDAFPERYWLRELFEAAEELSTICRLRKLTSPSRRPYPSAVS